MGLLSIFQRKQSADASGPDAVDAGGDAVQQARLRARRRLVGATVLVLTGIVAFPLVFETQPRPIPVDIPIEIPRTDAAPPLQMPPARPSSTAPSQPGASSQEAAGQRAGTSPPASRDAAAAQTASLQAAPPQATSSQTAPRPSAAASQRQQAAAPPDAEGKTPPPARVPTASPADPRPSAKPPAKPSADAKPAGAQAGGRYVVQIGAFADAAPLRDARAKAEKLGLKTYTQVADTPSGRRTRVRVGPFATREEADKALARLKAAGLGGVVLTL